MRPEEIPQRQRYQDEYEVIFGRPEEIPQRRRYQDEYKGILVRPEEIPQRRIYQDDYEGILLGPRRFRNDGDTKMSTRKFWMRSESIDMEDCDNLREKTIR